MKVLNAIFQLIKLYFRYGNVRIAVYQCDETGEHVTFNSDIYELTVLNETNKFETVLCIIEKTDFIEIQEGLDQ